MYSIQKRRITATSPRTGLDSDVLYLSGWQVGWPSVQTDRHLNQRLGGLFGLYRLHHGIVGVTNFQLERFHNIKSRNGPVRLNSSKLHWESFSAVFMFFDCV
jgi:hypothetical protein